MRADYRDALDRHWLDAEDLNVRGRFANADHLYGVAAECGLKFMMILFGMNTDPAKGDPTNRKDWVHADGAWTRYEAYRSGIGSGIKYALPASNLFSDWRVSQRYGHRGNFDATRASRHRAGTIIVRKMTAQARADGLMS